jgi:hypothetical protein
MLIGDVIVNKNILAVWLERLSHVDWSESTLYDLLEPDWDVVDEQIHTLLSPKDSQNVPRAIKLIKLTSDIRSLDPEDFDPSELKTYRALSLLGEMLAALLDPFIDSTFTLRQQIVSLIVAAHIACALYIQHEGDFMPQALYSDFQNMFRSAIFRVAHAKNLDPEQVVLLCLLGDDVLEILFGRARMIGRHNPNVTCGELRERFGSAICLDKIFDEFPHLERIARRLNMSRAGHLDHLSPRHWKGELRASSCDLEECWMEAVQKSEDILRKHDIVIDFKTLFTNWQESGIDLLRPRGGKYVGISSEVDRSITEEASDVPMDQDLDAAAEIKRIRAFDGRKALAEEQAALAEARPHSVWMKLDNGKLAHKTTILRLVMDRALDLDYKMSHDRLSRVRYFSIGGDNWDRSKRQGYGALPTDNLFHLGSIYGTLVCIGERTICVAIMTCTSIKSGGHLIERAPLDEISLDKSEFSISGQILSLSPYTTSPTTGDMAGINVPVHGWIWDSTFISLDVTKTKIVKNTNQTSTTRIKNLNITVNGRLVRPLLRGDVESIVVANSDIEVLPPQLANGDFERTWHIKETTISLVEAELYAKVNADNAASESLRDRIPAFIAVREGVLPYRSTGKFLKPLKSTIMTQSRYAVRVRAHDTNRSLRRRNTSPVIW